MSGKFFVAYDGRAASGDTGDASILCSYGNGESLEQVKREAEEDFGHAVIYSYDTNPNDGVTLINEKMEAIVGGRRQ